MLDPPETQRNKSHREMNALLCERMMRVCNSCVNPIVSKYFRGMGGWFFSG